MLDMGFEPEIRQIIAQCPAAGSAQETLSGEARQTLFFTATWPPDVQRSALHFTHHALRVEVGQSSGKGGGGGLATNTSIKQTVKLVKEEEKLMVLKQAELVLKFEQGLLMFASYPMFQGYYYYLHISQHDMPLLRHPWVLGDLGSHPAGHPLRPEARGDLHGLYRSQADLRCSREGAELSSKDRGNMRLTCCKPSPPPRSTRDTLQWCIDSVGIHIDWVHLLFGCQKWESPPNKPWTSMDKMLSITLNSAPRWHF